MCLWGFVNSAPRISPDWSHHIYATPDLGSQSRHRLKITEPFGSRLHTDGAIMKTQLNQQYSYLNNDKNGQQSVLHPTQRENGHLMRRNYGTADNTQHSDTVAHVSRNTDDILTRVTNLGKTPLLRPTKQRTHNMENPRNSDLNQENGKLKRITRIRNMASPAQRRKYSVSRL